MSLEDAIAVTRIGLGARVDEIPPLAALRRVGSWRISTQIGPIILPLKDYGHLLISIKLRGFIKMLEKS